MQRVYTRLFSIYQKQQRLGEQYEVVLGLGLLSWKTSEGHHIRRHIVTAQTDLQFELSRGIISVGPAGEGANLALEQDMLDPKFRPDVNELNAFEGQLKEIGDDIWNGVNLESLLSSWIHAVSPNGTFEDSLLAPAGVAEEPRLHWAPAILLRKRSERSFLKAFEEILRQLEAGTPVPNGVAQFVSVTSDSEGTQNSLGTSQNNGDSGELYFPLESNEAQRQIIERLQSHQGVLVQGPPGTGKSHTIVNLVCHLLATGQRVLVTSHTARALRVLRHYIQEKVPAIAPLAVVVLGDDRESLQAMEESVQGITDRHNHWEPTESDKLIVRLEEELDTAWRDEASVLGNLRSIREAETFVHPRIFENYEGTLQRIATRLHGDSDKYSWFTDTLLDDAELPLQPAELSELLSLLRDGELASDRLHDDVIDPENLEPPETVTQLIRHETEKRRKFDAAESARSHPGYPGLRKASSEVRQNLSKKLLVLVHNSDRVTRHILPWTKKAVTEILGDRDRAWRHLFETTKAATAKIGDRARWVDSTTVTGLEQRDYSIVRADAQALLTHLERGGRWGFGPFRPNPVKNGLYLIKEIRLDGQLCNKQHLLQELVHWLVARQQIKLLQKIWNPYTEVPQGTVSDQVAHYEDMCEPLEEAISLHSEMKGIQELIRGISGLSEPTWHELENLQSLLAASKAVDPELDLLEATRQLDEVVETYESLFDLASSVEVRCLVDAVRGRDGGTYTQQYSSITKRHTARLSRLRRDDLLTRLASGAPLLVKAVSETPEEVVWDERIENLNLAWNWSKAVGWINRMCDSQAEEQLRLQLDEARSRAQKRLGEISSVKAWGYCFEAMTEHQRQHLIAWSKAMKNLGKGTGKYAPMHRRAAREHMAECRTAIPAWIMPLYRVAETMRPGKDLFDVAIIDEASQSGPEALLLTYLAKKIVVVGDDKQIAPEFVGIDREDVNQLRLQHISTLPHNDQYGVDNSFFDLAEIRYQGRIRLREHFRCMPEIIQFSNNLCYNTQPLIPLKQYGLAHLEPVVGTRHVSDGYLKGVRNRVNPPEANAIVAAIIELCENPAYRDKTVGVISLLGHSQAQLIERTLLERLGPEAMERRQIVCGDAYAFQGDERDVIFLSLVSAPVEGRRIRTLASARDERRFNVAASRARDQMWLFHTATLNDLGPNCLRYKLLEYCQNPTVQTTSLAGISIEDLRRLSAYSDRRQTPKPDPFDSWFEVDVFLKTVDRGYRVIPQYHIAGKWIDLLVEGMDGRIAVECDGDHWHGPEEYEKDTGRQRMLQRCGLVFWRIRESVFRLDPDKAMESLWEKLERYKIFPKGHVGTGVGEDGKKTGDFANDTDTTARSETVEGQLNLARSGEQPANLRQTISEEADEQLPKSIMGVESERAIGLLHPYRNWNAHPLQDPREGPPPSLIPGLLEIIAEEGPMCAYRAFQLYARAAGILRIPKPLKTRFEEALTEAIRRGDVLDREEIGKTIVWRAETPEVVLRERGDRTFREIPPFEILKLMGELERSNPELDKKRLFRQVCEHLSIRRLTKGIHQILSEIYHEFKVNSGRSTEREDSIEGIETNTKFELVQFPTGDTVRNESPSVELQPYVEWESHPLPDPRYSISSDIISGLVEIIAAEGPMLAYRAFQLYGRAAGIQRVRESLRIRFEESLARAIKIGLIEEEVEGGKQVVRKAGTPKVIWRRRASRQFHEIPQSEITELLKTIREINSAWDRETLYREVTGYLEIGRLTASVRSTLDRICSDIEMDEKNSESVKE